MQDSISFSQHRIEESVVVNLSLFSMANLSTKNNFGRNDNTIKTFIKVVFTTNKIGPVVK